MLLRKGSRGGAPAGTTPEPTAAAAAPDPGVSMGAPADPGDPSSQLDSFAREVLAALSQDNLPPFPSYFQLYFEKLLDDKPMEFRKQMMDLMETESSTEDEKRMRIEQQLQEGFTISKEILQNVAVLYKNISTMSEVSKRRLKEAKSVNNPSAVQNLTLALANDLNKLTGALNRQAGSIKGLYTKSAKIIQEVKGETIYDAVYGIFNRRYLLEQMGSELKMMEKFSHKSSLVIAKLADEVQAQVQSEKQLGMINRTISKLFMKTSRRSDVVAHLGDGQFAMLLKHTDEENAGRAANRLADMVSGSHFFIGDKEVELKVAIGIAPLETHRGVEEILGRTLEVMFVADKEGATFKIAEGEGNGSDGFDIP